MFDRKRDTNRFNWSERSYLFLLECTMDVIEYRDQICLPLSGKGEVCGVSKPVLWAQDIWIVKFPCETS